MLTFFILAEGARAWPRRKCNSYMKLDTTKYKNLFLSNMSLLTFSFDEALNSKKGSLPGVVHDKLPLRYDVSIARYKRLAYRPVY